MDPIAYDDAGQASDTKTCKFLSEKATITRAASDFLYFWKREGAAVSSTKAKDIGLCSGGRNTILNRRMISNFELVSKVVNRFYYWQSVRGP